MSNKRKSNKNENLYRETDVEQQCIVTLSSISQQKKYNKHRRERRSNEVTRCNSILYCTHLDGLAVEGHLHHINTVMLPLALVREADVASQSLHFHLQK